ncbi:ABC transporter permease [Cohnella hongkongensis]|uniref:ABC transporter permease n=1 Tax=Cohnella hongkongensis TaxID=178337 RepID=A0ABV9F6L0_9BACL
MLVQHHAKKKIKKLLSNKLTAAGLLILLLVVVCAVFAPWLAPYPGDATGEINFAFMNQAPSAAHWFGTDEVERDILSRVVFGARYSLVMGVMVMAIAVLIGVPLGLIAGFWGGMVNAVIMRITDIFLAVPSIILAMTTAALLSPSLMNAMLAISFGWWPWFTRLVQAEVLKLRNEPYVSAAVGIGSSKWRIVFREILPNCLSPIIVKISTDMGAVILTGASLGFLGLGAQPPSPEWGTMVAEGRVYLPTMWWQTTFPGLAILVTVLGCNLVGDGLRDFFDVKVD